MEKTYDGEVVWSNTDIDMSIVKISQNNLQIALLGNSDDIKVGENSLCNWKSNRV